MDRTGTRWILASTAILAAAGCSVRGRGLSMQAAGGPHLGDGYVAAWRSGAGAAERIRRDVGWLAAREREGRGIGTAGLAATADWLEARMRALGLSPGGQGGTFRQGFPVRVGITRERETAVIIDGAPVAAHRFQPLGFSRSGDVAGEAMPAGYGISAKHLGHDDYANRNVKGKIVVVKRFVPASMRGRRARRRYSDLAYKAWNARSHGAVGLVIVDLPAPGSRVREAPLPGLRVPYTAQTSVPTVVVKRAVGANLFRGNHRVRLRVRLRTDVRQAHNIVGVIRATHPRRLSGAIVLGAHYDHLGYGGHGSFVHWKRVVHPGADDNASGVAALLEAARRLARLGAKLRRDVYVVAFSGEETGVVGSTTFTRSPPGGLVMKDVVAMINMDMVGRLRRRLAIVGSESAREWEPLLKRACAAAGLGCRWGGDGYGPSDHSPFYAAGIPALQLFTGAHRDYHRPSDVAERVRVKGVARIATVATTLATEVANREARLTYKTSPKPAPLGDVRSYGAYLGTIPDYLGHPEKKPGMLLAGVRVGGPAHAAGMRRGDLLVRLGKHEIRGVRDLMYVLRASHPGERTIAVVERDGKRLSLPATYGSRRALRTHVHRHRHGDGHGHPRKR